MTSFNIVNRSLHEPNTLAGLLFENGGYSNLLSPSGNAVQMIVESPQVKTLSATPPGQSFELRRRLGFGPRRARWLATLKGTTYGNLAIVESYIEAYIADGRPYTLVDSWGRQGDWTVLDSARRVGPRMAAGSGAFVQRWEIGFTVLRPNVFDANGQPSL